MQNTFACKMVKCNGYFPPTLSILTITHGACHANFDWQLGPSWCTGKYQYDKDMNKHHWGKKQNWTKLQRKKFKAGLDRGLVEVEIFNLRPGAGFAESPSPPPSRCGWRRGVHPPSEPQACRLPTKKNMPPRTEQKTTPHYHFF